LLLRGSVNLFGDWPANDLRCGRIDRTAAAAAKSEHSGTDRGALQHSKADAYGFHKISSGQVKFVAGVSHRFSFALRAGCVVKFIGKEAGGLQRELAWRWIVAIHEVSS
jgi:hypothetical protein